MMVATVDVPDLLLKTIIFNIANVYCMWQVFHTLFQVTFTISFLLCTKLFH